MLYLFIAVDVSVGHAGEELLEVVSLVALPALPVGLQVRVETLHFVLALLHLQRHLRRERERELELQGRSGDIIKKLQIAELQPQGCGWSRSYGRIVGKGKMFTV